MKHLHMLTGLRGLAALIVFISHSSDRGLLPSIIGYGFGAIGVMLFFVLSGFLMAHLYIQKEVNYTNVRTYALARIGRIVPLYLTVLLSGYIISKYLYPDFFWHDLQNQTDFLLSLFFITGPYVFWTIPVEVQFYVVFVAFWWLYQKKAHPLVLIGAVGLTLLPSLILYLFIQKLPSVYSAYGYAFFIGVFIALLFRQLKDNQTIKKIADLAGLPFAILLFINIPGVREKLGWILHENMYIQTWADPFNWIIICGVFVSALYGSKGLFFLNWRPIVFLGEISYGVYLLHEPILAHVRIPGLSLEGNLVIAFALTITLAYLSFKYFERPIAKRIRNTRVLESLPKKSKQPVKGIKGVEVKL